MAKCNQLTPLTFQELNCIEVSAEIVLAFRRLHNENFHRLRKFAQLLLKTLDNYIYRLTERPSLASNEPCSLPTVASCNVACLYRLYWHCADRIAAGQVTRLEYLQA